jgi:hypothetical protein
LHDQPVVAAGNVIVPAPVAHAEPTLSANAAVPFAVTTLGDVQKPPVRVGTPVAIVSFVPVLFTPFPRKIPDDEILPNVADPLLFCTSVPASFLK